jgi:hypothetical protein
MPNIRNQPPRIDASKKIGYTEYGFPSSIKAGMTVQLKGDPNPEIENADNVNPYNCLQQAILETKKIAGQQ